MRTIRTRSGRSYQTRRRGIANGSIRRTLDTTERVLRDAKRRGVLSGEVPPLKSGARKAERPRRSFLELRADCRRPACRRSDRGRAPRAHVGGGRADPALEPLRAVVGTRVRDLGHPPAQGPPRGAVERDSSTTQPQQRPSPRDRRDADSCRAAGLGAMRSGRRTRRHSKQSSPHPQIRHEDRRWRAQRSDCAGPPRAARRAPKATSGGPGRACVPHTEFHPSGSRQHPCAHSRAGSGTSQRVARERGQPTDSANDSAHPAAHVPSILAVCDVPPRRAMCLMGHTDPTLINARRLSAGPGHGQGLGRASRASPRMHARRSPSYNGS